MIEPRLVFMAMLAALMLSFAWSAYKKRNAKKAEIVQAIQSAAAKPPPAGTTPLLNSGSNNRPLSVNEAIALVSNDARAPVAAGETQDFEDVSIKKLMGYVQVLRELQTRTAGDPVLNAEQSEFESGSSEIERNTAENVVSNDNKGNDYEVVLFMAHREFQKLSMSSKGAGLLQQHFGTVSV